MSVVGGTSLGRPRGCLRGAEGKASIPRRTFTQTRHLHRGDGGLGTRDNVEGGERRGVAGRLDVIEGRARRKGCDLGCASLGLGNDVRAVRERANVLTENSQLSHSRSELLDHEILVRCAQIPFVSPLWG